MSLHSSTIRALVFIAFLMPTAEENSENWAACGDLLSFEGLDKFSIDIETILAILSEDPVPSQNQPKNSPEELSCKNSFQGEATAGEVNNGFSQSQDGVQEYEAPQVEAGLAGSSVWCPSTAGIQSVCMLGNPGNSSMAFDHSNIDALCHFDSPLRTSVNLGDWSTSRGEHDTCSSREMDGGTINAHFYSSKSTSMLNQIPNYGTTLNFSAGDSDLAPGYTDNMDLSHLKRENRYEFKHAGENYDSQNASHLIMMEESNLAFRDSNDVIGSNKEDLGLQETSIPTSNMDAIFINSEMSFGSAHPQLNDNKASIAINQYPVGSLSECFSIGNDLANSSQFQSHKFDLLCMTSMEETMARTKGELEDKLCKNSKINFKREGIVGLSVLPESSSVVCTETNSFQDNVNIQGMARYPPIRMKSFCDPDGNTVNTPRQLTGSNSVTRHSGIVGDEGYFSGVSPPNGVVCGPSVDNAASHLVTDTLSLISSKRQKISIKDEKKDDLVLPMSFSNHSTKYSGQLVKSSLSVCRSHVDDDPDICILEDISDPRHPPALAGLGKSLVTSQHLQNDPLYISEHASMRLKANDERLTFRVALQDLSQTKSEASPPDGVLAVPLMRHQRIALSWMVQKETVSLHCSGGILADDQGLGKTISTIALILKERPPLSKTTLTTMKQDGTKALNLDDDDDETSACMPEIKHEGYSLHMEVSTSSTKNEAAFSTKGRPAAGTLIVCPTSVLRQWAEELRNKVTREANLSVLVYHGSNRTKDPLELANYDVVVTTYSIVSMEVPKQSLVDKDDGEKVKPEGHDLSPMELSCKKRKYPPSSDKKNRKDKKGIDGTLLESVARPLARVGWFRVVLDEAQSIKNHRTQVARACWGLRAKRRWCLSGTPIQNAVDDLYSYFRFLRYDPYAVYNLFCSMIKVPINRNPTNGYKKLQAVLKTIMLRRTKGTCIDGEPIINLPPKTVELRKVDFSMEERDFYSKLEADSRAQFKLYAAAGTVQQNYVNILLMLLRLRQACDHPQLVKGFDSNSVWRSSLETAKKLPREKQTVLLSCLEASLAICGICNDSPEEAVVTICGHVFCNQCISEHLTGDDNLCPASQCKVQLNATSVFSSATLKHTLFDQPNASQTDLALDPCSEGFSVSSKIKTALEVLESLSNSKVSSINPMSEVPRTAADSQLLELSKDMLGKEISDKEITDKPSSKISEKAIVFSQWTRMLDLLESRLKTSSIQYRRLDGTMSVVARDKAVKDFNTLPEVTVMIMSLKAASLGLNMVAACHVLLLDLWWNPTTEDQAIDRAHRIGQTRPVSVLRLTVKDTVEDRILALQQKKREMVASAFGEDETGSRQSRLTVDDLKYLFMD